MKQSILKRRKTYIVTVVFLLCLSAVALLLSWSARASHKHKSKKIIVKVENSCGKTTTNLECKNCENPMRYKAEKQVTFYPKKAGENAKINLCLGNVTGLIETVGNEIRSNCTSAVEKKQGLHAARQDSIVELKVTPLSNLTEGVRVYGRCKVHYEGDGWEKHDPITLYYYIR